MPGAGPEAASPRRGARPPRGTRFRRSLARTCGRPWRRARGPPDPSCPMPHAAPGTAFPPNDVYTAAMLAALGRLRAAGVEVIVFGDIFLADLRAFRDRLLAH